MSQVAEQPTTNVELWRKYREAFREFTRRANAVQLLKENADPARALIDDALMELEMARLRYNNCRDALACALLPDTNLSAGVSQNGGRQDYVGHVREIADLLWNLENRREGRADEDWYRAERIVRSAAATTPEIAEFTAA